MILVVGSTPCLAGSYYSARIDLASYTEDNVDKAIENLFANMTEEQADALKQAFFRISLALSDGSKLIAVLDGKTPAEIVQYSESPEIQEAFKENFSLLIQEAMEECAKRQRVVEKWAPIVGFIVVPILSAVALLIAVKVTGNEASFLALILISFVARIFFFIPWVGWLISGVVLWILLCRVSKADIRDGFLIMVLAWGISLLIWTGLLSVL